MPKVAGAEVSGQQCGLADRAGGEGPHPCSAYRIPLKQDKTQPAAALHSRHRPEHHMRGHELPLPLPVCQSGGTFNHLSSLSASRLNVKQE